MRIMELTFERKLCLTEYLTIVNTTLLKSCGEIQNDLERGIPIYIC